MGYNLTNHNLVNNSKDNWGNNSDIGVKDVEGYYPISMLLSIGIWSPTYDCLFKIIVYNLLVILL